MTVEDYILFIEVGHSIQQELNRRTLEASDLTLQQAAVLAKIESAGGRATISRLASELSRASHSVSGMITSLEDAGLVNRERATSKDRRQVWVSMSTLGKRRYASYKRALDNIVEPNIDGLITSDEAERLVQVVQGIAT